MAEGGDTGYGFSFYYDSSEEMRTINCDPCNFENKTEEAEGFCINCDEYLCKSCLQAHQKFRAFRTHNLLYRDAMPKRRNEGREDMCTGTLFSYCDAHPTNQVQHYCRSHQAVYCRICQTTKHSTCESQEISQVTNIERDRSQLHEAVMEIQNLEKSFENLKESDGTKIDQLQARTRSSTAGLGHLQEKMNDIFKLLQKEIKQEDYKAEAHIKLIREKLAVSTDAVNHIASFRRNISQIEESNESVVVFAALVKSMNQASDYKEVRTNIEQTDSQFETSDTSTRIGQLTEVCEDIVTLLELKFKEETDEIPTEQPFLPEFKENTTDEHHNGKDKVGIQQAKSNKIQEKDNVTDRRTQFLQPTERPEAKEYVKASYKEKLTRTNDTTSENRSIKPEKRDAASTQPQGTERLTIASSCSSTPERNRKSLIDLAVFSKSKHTVQTSDCGIKCDITGCLFLTTGSLILCDHAHSNIILLDDEFHLADKLYLKGNAWDVALSGKHEVIVSLVRAKRLEFVHIIGGKLYRIKGMDLKRVCWGVASDGDKIFLACHNNPGGGMVEIRKKTGQILKQITLTDQSIQLLMPYYISLDKSNSRMYISDAKQNSVICVNMQGEVQANIQTDILNWPRAMIVGENQTLAICSSFSNSLVLLRQQTGQWQSKRLLHIERPQAVSIRWQDKTMAIALNQSNTITILKCTG